MAKPETMEVALEATADLGVVVVASATTSLAAKLAMEEPETRGATVVAESS